MELKNGSLSIFLVLLYFFFIILSSVSASAPAYLSDGIFRDGASIGRNLLQAKKACPVNFEFLDYTVVTSKCKGPKYSPDVCCGAFKELACPYADQLNDLSNECATTMFSYINLYGKYPPGLFSSECREGKLGLECPANSPSQADNASGNWILTSPPPLLVLTTGFLVSLLSWI